MIVLVFWLYLADATGTLIVFAAGVAVSIGAAAVSAATSSHERPLTWASNHQRECTSSEKQCEFWTAIVYKKSMTKVRGKDRDEHVNEQRFADPVGEYAEN